MMLPLTTEGQRTLRPEAVQLRDSDGRVIDSRIVWMTTGPAKLDDHWTADPRRLVAHSAGSGERPDDAGRYFLLARLPDDGDGELRLGSQPLRPTWRDMPRTESEVDRGGRLSLARSPVRPDPDSPFEYWRWALLAERIGVEPPDPAEYGEVGTLIAEHFADLWAIGLDRLAGQSEDVADLVRNVLTRSARDDEIEFASWTADPAQLSALLHELMNFARSDEDVMLEARAWVDMQDEPLIWPEAETPNAVRLAILNPSSEPVVARVSWAGIDDVPLGIELPPRRVKRVSIERPEPIDAQPAHPVAHRAAVPHSVTARPHILRVQVEGWMQELTFGPRSIAVTPPGLWLPPLEPPLNLARLQTGQAASAPPDHATLVHVRRMAGRWELFVECLRPEQGGGRNGRIASANDARGGEAVMLFIALAPPEAVDREGADVSLFIPETGWHQLLRGDNDGTLQVHRRSYEDRWYARVVLPDAWLGDAEEDEVTLLGVVRTHGSAPVAHYAPYPALPWRVDPGTFAVDLSQWRDLPGQ